MQTELQIAYIEMAGVIIAALITGGCLVASAFAVFSKKQLRLMLITALQDLKYFQHVERVHVEMEIGRNGKSNQRIARDRVEKEQGISHSAMTLSRVNQHLDRLSRIDE